MQFLDFLGTFGAAEQKVVDILSVCLCVCACLWGRVCAPVRKHLLFVFMLWTDLYFMVRSDVMLMHT